MGPSGVFVVFRVGPVVVTNVVVTTWAIIAVLAIFSLLVSRQLRLEPSPLQAAIEGAFEAIDDAIRSVLPEQSQLVLPFIATLWIFITVANLSGVLPGLRAPTSDLSATAALAVLVFLSVHWFGIKADGFKAYLRHYLRPNPILLPFHIVSEISRTLALAIRLFGNIMSLELAALLALAVAGLFAPIPILMLHIIEALVQAYIFGMLAMIYIAGGIQSHELKREKAKT